MEVVWRAIPGILAAATPHRGGLSTEETGLVDECNSVHEGEVRGTKKSGRERAFRSLEGAVYKPRIPRRESVDMRNECENSNTGTGFQFSDMSREDSN